MYCSSRRCVENMKAISWIVSEIIKKLEPKCHGLMDEKVNRYASQLSWVDKNCLYLSTHLEYRYFNYLYLLTYTWKLQINYITLNLPLTIIEAALNRQFPSPVVIIAILLDSSISGGISTEARTSTLCLLRSKIAVLSI